MIPEGQQSTAEGSAATQASTAQNGCAPLSDAHCTECSTSDHPDKQKQHVYTHSKIFLWLLFLPCGNGVLQFFGLNSMQKLPLVLISFHIHCIVQFYLSNFCCSSVCVCLGGGGGNVLRNLHPCFTHVTQGQIKPSHHNSFSSFSSKGLHHGTSFPVVPPVTSIQRLFKKRKS